MTQRNRSAQGTPALPANLGDYAALAQAVLDPMASAYFNGGAADEITLRSNVAAWQRVSLVPRVLRPLAALNSAVRILGRQWAHPLIAAPIAYQCMAHPHGEAATALASAAQQAGFILSTQSSTPMEDVARIVLAEPQRGPLWFQLYPQADRHETLALARRAQACGYEALVLTVDAPVHGVRDRERAAGFRLPEGVRAVHLPGATGNPSLLNLLAQAPTWDDVCWLQEQVSLPLLLKGVLHPTDARQAARLNIRGVIVSNHGGRTLDGAVASAAALQPVARAIRHDEGLDASQFALLVDGGIRRGTDVLKALALGADAVLVGRPLIWGLAHAGAAGVAHTLRLLRDEFDAAMALSGCTSPADVNAIGLGTAHNLRPDRPADSSPEGHSRP